MKKAFLPVLLLVLLLPALSACKRYDYTAHVSEAKSDLFCAETQEFSLTLSCVTREYPYAADGIAAAPTQLIEISLVPCDHATADFCVFVTGEEEWGGEMSFRNAQGDYFYSQGVNVFPQGSVTMRVEWDGNVREICATSIKNENTLTVSEALLCAVAAEKETISRMHENGAFRGEFHVRLLRREATYYYVGIVDRTGRTIALLLDSESGEILARHTAG